MNAQQVFVLVFTFFVGLCAGAYIYITGYAPNYNLSMLRDEFVRSGSLTVRGEQIGGCQMVGVCPSFELTEDRRYRYTKIHGLNDDTPDPIEGRLDPTVFSDLRTVAEGSDLIALQDEGEVCNAAVDGIDYVYDVIIDGVSYELNSCGTQFYGSRLYNELLKLWGLMMKEEAEESQVEN